MLFWRKPLIVLAVLSAVALLAPAAALASGPSAGDQQYIDPLGGGSGSSSHHGSGGSHGGSSGSGASSAGSTAPAPAPAPAPAAPAPTATVSGSTTTAATPSTATAVPAASSAAPKAGDPSRTLPMTGFDAWAGAAAGAAMLAGGLLLRRTARGS